MTDEKAKFPVRLSLGQISGQDSGAVMGVYLLHFDREIDHESTKRYGDKRHYIGSSRDIEHRIGQHVGGNGSAVTKAAVEANARITVAAIYPMSNPDRIVEVENALTVVGASTLCPICQSTGYAKASRGPAKYGTTSEDITCGICMKPIRAGKIFSWVDGLMCCYYHGKTGR